MELLDRGEWRIRYNAELNGLSKAHDTVRFVKTQRNRWLGHVEGMWEERMAKRGDYSPEEGRDDHVEDGWTMW
jgi:hypothetical protein